MSDTFRRRIAPTVFMLSLGVVSSDAVAGARRDGQSGPRPDPWQVPIAVTTRGAGSNWSIGVFASELRDLWHGHGVTLVFREDGTDAFERAVLASQATLVVLSDSVPTLLEVSGGSISDQGLAATLLPAGPIFVRVERVRSLMRVCPRPDGEFVTLSTMLARVVAHELGHLLIGAVHAHAGLMRERFGCGDLQARAADRYWLTPAEFAAIQARLGAGTVSARRAPTPR